MISRRHLGRAFVACGLTRPWAARAAAEPTRVRRVGVLDPRPKSLQLLAEAIGKRAPRVAALQPAANRALPWFPALSAAVLGAAQTIGMRLVIVDIRSVDEFAGALERLARDGVDGISMDFAQPLRGDFERIAALLIEHRLPSIGEPASGFLLSYQPSLAPLARKAAEYVDRILRGARPGDLPVEQASAFELTIDLRTAEALRLKLPESLRVRAARLIR